MKQESFGDMEYSCQKTVYWGLQKNLNRFVLFASANLYMLARAVPCAPPGIPAPFRPEERGKMGDSSPLRSLYILFCLQFRLHMCLWGL